MGWIRLTLGISVYWSLKTATAQMLRLRKSKKGRKETVLTTLKKKKLSIKKREKMSLNCYKHNTKLKDK